MEPRGPHVMSSLGIISIDELIIKGTLSPPLQGKECSNEFKKKCIFATFQFYNKKNSLIYLHKFFNF